MTRLSNYPIVANLWAYLREKLIFRKHKLVSLYWKPIINEYFDDKLPKLNVIKMSDVVPEKVIWQYWGQANDQDRPKVVDLCFESVDKYCGDWTVIRLDDSNISTYLEFPSFVTEKVENGTFNRTFFSDLLRLALLKHYGGVWLDATVLLSGPIPSEFSSYSYFMFQRDSREIYKSFWKKSYAYYWNWNPKFRVNVLNSIFFAKNDSQVVTTLLDIMLYYWNTQNEVKDYFFFQILYDELMNNSLKELRCEVVSDVLPHILQTKFNSEYPFVDFDEALKNSSLHKMSYFHGQSLDNFISFIEDRKVSFKAN